MIVKQVPSFTASTAIPDFTRVKLESGKVAIADATDLSIGTTEAAAFDAGDLVAVLPTETPGVRRLIADGAIALHAKVYSADGGKVSATKATGSYFCGHAMRAASRDGSHVDVLTSTTE